MAKIEPKAENMDGDGFLTWMWKVETEVRRQAAMIRVHHREWAIAAFNSNYDPKAAAYAWLAKSGKGPHSAGTGSPR